MIPKNIFFYWDSEIMHDTLQDNINFIKNQNKEYDVKVISPDDFINLLERNLPENFSIAGLALNAYSFNFSEF